MIKVRRGVFETNSSSTHSIIVARDNPEVQDVVIFGVGEFGWECEKYNNTEDKASYFYTAACSVKKRDVADDITALLSPYGITCKFYPRALFKDWEYNGKRFSCLDNGYIDHDDECEEFVNSLLNDESLLIDYLFSDNSYVETGNDNDDEDVGLEHPEYEYVEFYKGN